MDSPWTCDDQLRPRSPRARAAPALARGCDAAIWRAVPGPARAHVRAALARVLRAGVQLRRDVPRHPGPRDRTRAASSTRRRPTASRRSCRTSTRPRSRSSAPPRCGRCGSWRCSRSRSPRCCSRSRRAAATATRAGWIAGDPVRARDGRVRAAGRAGRELRGVHAAVDDGGDPVRAPRARRRRGRRDRARDAREADRRGHVAPGALPARARAREARGRRGARSASAIPTALVALAVGPAPAPLLDGARQRLVRRHEDACRRSSRHVRR